MPPCVYSKKNMSVHLKMFLMNQEELILLSYYLSYPVMYNFFCIFRVIKLEGGIKHFWNRPKYDGCLKEKHLYDWVVSWTSCFLQTSSFLLERTTNSGCSDLGIWKTFSQKWTKWASHFKENKWHYLLLMIKFKCSNKNYNFRKLIHHGNLTTA